MNRLNACLSLVLSTIRHVPSALDEYVSASVGVVVERAEVLKRCAVAEFVLVLWNKI